MRIPLSRLRVVGTGLLFAIAAVASCVAQRLSSDQVRLGSITPVSPAGSGIHLMMFRATSEADRNVLMVCGTRLTTRTNGAEGFVYVSHDEGKTWKETMVEHSTEWSSEQSCTTDGNGRAYFAGGDSNVDLSVDRHGYGRMYLYSSVDAGRTWKLATSGPFLDWTNMTVNRGTDAHHGELYIFAHAMSNGHGEFIVERPVLFRSDDGGRTLRAPTFPPKPDTYTRVQAFPNDSIVVDENTILTTFEGTRQEFPPTPGATPPPAVTTTELMRTTDGGQTVEAPFVIGRPGDVSSFAIDRKAGTIYLAWTTNKDGHFRIMIGRSVDRGKTWQSNVAAEDAAGHTVSRGYPSIAVGQDGVLGLLFAVQNGTCFRFALSTDQGKSFRSVTDVVPCGGSIVPSREQFGQWLQSMPFEETAGVRPEIVRLPDGSADISSRGLSIRILAIDGFYRNAKAVLLVDGHGRFHAVWGDPASGNTEVLSRTIEVGAQLSTDSGLSVDGLQDVSRTVHVRFVNDRYRAATSTFYDDVVLVNSSATQVCAPILLLVTGLHSDFGSIEIDNADNGKRGRGAIWDMSSSLDHRELSAWGRSNPHTLAFVVNNLSIDGKDRGEAVSSGFKIYAAPANVCQVSH